MVSAKLKFILTSNWWLHQIKEKKTSRFAPNELAITFSFKINNNVDEEELLKRGWNHKELKHYKLQQIIQEMNLRKGKKEWIYRKKTSRGLYDGRTLQICYQITSLFTHLSLSQCGWCDLLRPDNVPMSMIDNPVFCTNYI